jgi:hypothetical protein
MDKVMNLLADMCAREENIEAAVVAVVMKPGADDGIMPTEIVTIGEDAVTILGITELIKLYVARQLEGRG